MKEADVAIIGGGPAGMSAALWCADLGLRAVLLERSTALGGQVANIFNPISNYLGLAAANGAELLEHFLRLSPAGPPEHSLIAGLWALLS